MKLYTEEQVRQAFNMGTWNKYEFEYEIKSLTPIELPSDEEIEKQFTIGTDIKTEYPHKIEGAKWMRDKILNK